MENTNNIVETLSKDSIVIALDSKGLHFLDNLTNYTKLEILNCDGNYLTSFPMIPNQLEILFYNPETIILYLLSLLTIIN